MKNINQPIVDKLTPMGFRVLLNIYQKSQETSSGFILPEQEHSGMPALAQITVVGKKTFWEKVQMIIGIKPRYKVGYWVYFRKYSVDELRINTSDGEMILYVLEESEIIGLVNTK